MNIQEATPIELTAEERAMLESMVRSPKTEQRLAKRAQVVLLAADRMSTRQIARTVGFSIGKASQWRIRFARDRVAGLQDKPRPGSKPTYTAQTGRRILAQLDEAPPTGYARWTAPLLSEALGDVSDQYIWRFLRAQKIDLSGRKSWCESPDPEFAAKAAEIIGLYLDPPDKAVVLAVDEKPSIQALERKQGYLKLANGRSLVGHGHTYTRHGTTTLFAALEVATGSVTTAHYRRRRRVEFLDFMNRLVAAYPGRELSDGGRDHWDDHRGNRHSCSHATIFDTLLFVRWALLMGCAPSKSIGCARPLKMRGPSSRQFGPSNASPAAERKARETTSRNPTAFVSCSSRAAMLTVSPRTVNSSRVSSPTTPQNASPACTPMPSASNSLPPVARGSGGHAPGVPASKALAQVSARRASSGRGDGKPNTSIAESPTNLSTTPSHRLAVAITKRRKSVSNWPVAAGSIVSARPAKPRMSTNITATVWRRPSRNAVKPLSAS
jgi:transposase